MTYQLQLITRIASYIMVPRGGNIYDAIEHLSDKDKLMNALRKAQQRTRDYIEGIKNSRDNPYGDDEEAIAKAILDKLEELE